MAKAFCRQLGHEVKCASTGSWSGVAVHPDAIRAMDEIGIGLGAARTKPLDTFADARFDDVATMGCGEICLF